MQIGITGEVFRSQKPVISLKGKKEKNFHEVDNMGSYTELRNFVFVPMHGIGGTKVGVLQLFNKRDGEPDETDLDALRPYERLAGQMMQNVIELNIAIDMEINVRKVLDELGQKTALDEVQELEYNFGMNKVQKRLLKLQDLISDKLERRLTRFQAVCAHQSLVSSPSFDKPQQQ